MLHNDEIIFKDYRRHNAKVKETLVEVLGGVKDLIGNEECTIAFAGSAGIGLAEITELDFVQEVVAATSAVHKFIPKTDVVIELGGEDAKVIFFGKSIEQRMNGSCAGGTGAFIDQMAVLLDTDSNGINEMAKNYTRIYPIASRCGVFAKSDIQPLLNQGARKEDLAASVMQAIVNQTIAGLSQGRKIKGNIAFLGGPLFFLSELRKAFVRTLKLADEEIIFPDNAQFYVAIGAALESLEFKAKSYEEIMNALKNTHKEIEVTERLDPLFRDEEEYKEFINRHEKYKVESIDINSYSGNAYLGIDAGSTTTKIVLINEKSEILYSFYSSNKGNPLDVIRTQLIDLLHKCGDRIQVVSSCVTGYGEEMIAKAFDISFGYVETICHYKAASFFNPDVDYIIDIGGQDIKSFKIKNNALDSIMLNEACSSGCGSFIETFAKSLGYDVISFSKLGLFAKNPASLGTKCTVFMNSSVKQVQKEGATVGDISAGISMSVVKNALYKVIRITNPALLGKNIVVQGGTFYNDAVLRSFEKEMKREVIRPNIAGIMGAFGCALIAKEKTAEAKNTVSLAKLLNFTNKSKNVTCELCSNKCLLTINIFEENKVFTSGNKCERGVGGSKNTKVPNMFTTKYDALMNLPTLQNAPRGQIGIPMVLNFFDNYPFWNAFFNDLGFEIVLSGKSNKDLYFSGQETIPSDTVCYPAKIVHGHIESLIKKDIKNIFYPILVYNYKEKKYVDDSFNCPVVAYYPELIENNVDELKSFNFMNPYFDIQNKDFPKKAFEYFSKFYKDITLKEIKEATNYGNAMYDKFKLEQKVMTE
ncbi:MAG: acyl-CoA dehydratase activase, partial [Fusobacteriaceae bacterium]